MRVIEDAGRGSAGPAYSLAEVVERSGIPARTIRYYQSEHLLPPPERRGREAVYHESHLERLALIVELRDRGLTLRTIRQLLDDEHPARTVGEWLGIDATLTEPWSDDRARVVDREELRLMIGGEQPGVLAELEQAGFVRPAEPGTWLVPSPALVDLALELRAAGIDIDISGRLRDLLSRRLAKAVNSAVKLLVERTGAGFGGSASSEDLALALGALRPAAREMTSIILAQQVERALRQLAESGPAGVRRARRR